MENAKQITLQQNVLNDNVLIIPNKGKIFKGGYIAIIQEYKFFNAWRSEKEIKKFRSETVLKKYLNKHYPQVEVDFQDTCIEE